MRSDCSIFLNCPWLFLVFNYFFNWIVLKLKIIYDYGYGINIEEYRLFDACVEAVDFLTWKNVSIRHVEPSEMNKNWIHDIERMHSAAVFLQTLKNSFKKEIDCSSKYFWTIKECVPVHRLSLCENTMWTVPVVLKKIGTYRGEQKRKKKPK